jgi:hypothetical protein
MSQTVIEPSELDSLYLRALGLRWDLLRSPQYKYFEINSNTERIKDLSISPIFKFVSIPELNELSKNKKRGIDVYRMDHKVISADTIDISLYILTAYSKEDVFICVVKGGGTLGYHTDIKFALRKEDSTWEVIENRFDTSK